MYKKLIKFCGVLSALSFLSRLIGIYKEASLAKILGVGESADLFVFADHIPKALYGIVVDGIAAHAILPVLAGYQGAKKADRRALLERSLVGICVAILSCVLLACLVAAPVLVMIFGMGWFWDWLNSRDVTGLFWRAIHLLSITLPFFFFMSLSGLLGVCLNIRKCFLGPACTPIIVNITLIAVARWVAPSAANPVAVLAFGLSGGGCLVLGLQAFLAYRAGVSLWPLQINSALPGIRRIFRLIPMVALGAALMQVSFLATVLIGSFLTHGSIGALNYAYRVVELPAGALGVGLRTLIFPMLARCHHKASDMTGESELNFKATLKSGIQLTLLMILPCAVTVGCLGHPLLSFFYSGASFTPEAYQMVFWSLQLYNLSFMPHNLMRILALAYYARQEAYEPLKYVLLASIVELFIGLSAVWWGPLMFPVALNVAGTLQASLLWFGLRRGQMIGASGLFKNFCLKLTIAAAIMGLVLWELTPSRLVWSGYSDGQQRALLLGLLVLGFLVYSFSLWAIGLRKIDVIPDREIEKEAIPKENLLTAVI